MKLNESSSYLFGVLEVLLLTDIQKALFLDLIGQRFEAKLGTSGGQRLNNPGKQTRSRGEDRPHTHTHRGFSCSCW